MPSLFSNGLILCADAMRVCPVCGGLTAFGVVRTTLRGTVFACVRCTEPGVAVGNPATVDSIISGGAPSHSQEDAS